MEKIKKALLVAVSLAALALGGSAIAGAASGGDGSSSTAAPSSSPQGTGGLPPQRADETLLTGNVEAQVRKAALAEVSGGAIERVETDAPGHPRALRLAHERLWLTSSMLFPSGSRTNAA